jgi:hypothetical protein
MCSEELFNTLSTPNTAVDFRAGLRFPRVAREPPRSHTSLRGLTYSTFPAGVFVLHSNQQLDPTQSTFNNIGLNKVKIID